MSFDDQAAKFSAPGKVLLTGGYLVLFQEYTAYSVALTCRIHTVAERSSKGHKLVIANPQFNAEWAYDEATKTDNAFLDAIVETICAYFNKLPQGSVTVLSDPEFHSQEDTTPLQGHTQFLHHKKPIHEVAKTGLGSSAAFCVSVTAALYWLASPGPLDDIRRNKIHNLAQIAHCHAQGKIGSGFDVATAIYGSVLYSRFSSREIPEVTNHEALHQAVDRVWQMKHAPFLLPESISLIVGDVQCGSKTPGLVKKMLHFKESEPTKCGQLWAELNFANGALVNAIESESYHEIALCLVNVRKSIQELTRKSGVPVEPSAQTARLDAATEIEGVLGGVVPGAGGDDAICILAESHNLARVLAALRNHPRLEGVNWLPILPDSRGLTYESTNLKKD